MKRSTRPLQKSKSANKLDLAKNLYRFFMQTAPMCLIITGFAIILFHIWGKSLANPDFIAKSSSITYTQEVTNLSPQMLHDLRKISSFTANYSLLSPKLPGKMEKQIVKSAWIKRILNSRRDFPKKSLNTQVDLRVPRAQIRISGFYQAIDDDAVLLPVKNKRRKLKKLPLITCSLKENGETGTRLRNIGLHHALGVIKSIRYSVVTDKLPINLITVKQRTFIDTTLRKRQTLPSIDLVLKNGARIRWGTFNSNSQARDLLTSEKIEMLRELFQEQKTLLPHERIDIQTANIYYSASK